jgi:hypothetical protein
MKSQIAFYGIQEALGVVVPCTCPVVALWPLGPAGRRVHCPPALPRGHRFCQVDLGGAVTFGIR